MQRLKESWVQLQHPPTPTQWNLESEVRQIRQCRIYTVVHIKKPIRLFRKKTYELLKIFLHIFALWYAISDGHFLYKKSMYTFNRTERWLYIKPCSVSIQSNWRASLLSPFVKCTTAASVHQEKMSHNTLPPPPLYYLHCPSQIRVDF